MKSTKVLSRSLNERLTSSRIVSSHLRQVNLKSISLALTLALSFALPPRGSGAVILDDDWDDGDRTDTNLPEESAWYANVAAGTPTLSAAVGSLTGNVLVVTPDATNTTSRLWITHFTPAGSPVELGLKDMLKITLVFTPSNVAPMSATDRGFRIGLFNFSEAGAARVTGDGFSTGSGAGAPGTNVTGYMLNMNFGQTFGVTPLQIMKRTATNNVSLMGTTGGGVYTALPGTGSGTAGSPGFSNGVTYTFEFTVKRNAGSVELTTTFSDTNGWSISHTAMDPTGPAFRFDGFAIRPNSVADSAESFLFTRFKAEVLPFTPRITIRLSAFDTEVIWETIPNRMYQLEARDAFDAASDGSLAVGGEVIHRPRRESSPPLAGSP
jgi:hypothetical protein